MRTSSDIPMFLAADVEQAFIPFLGEIVAKANPVSPWGMKAADLLASLKGQP